MSIKTLDTGGLTPRVLVTGVSRPNSLQLDAVFSGFTFLVVSTHGSGAIALTTADARLFAKAIVDAADKIDIEAFVEAGVPLQRSDCE